MNFPTSAIAWTKRDFLRSTLRVKYGLSCANLFSKLPIQSAPIPAKALKPDKALLLSGVPAIQTSDVALALNKTGLHERHRKRKGKWT